MSKIWHLQEIQRSKSTSNSPATSQDFSANSYNNTPLKPHKNGHRRNASSDHSSDSSSFSNSSPTLQDEMVKHNMRSSRNGFYHYDENNMGQLPKFLKSKSNPSGSTRRSSKRHRNGRNRSKSKSNTNIFSSIRNTLNAEIYHALFLIVFNCQILLFSKMGTIFSLIASSLSYNIISIIFDYIGSIIAFFLFCWLHAFLSFEYKWIMEGKELKHRIKYFEERVPYFSGFGAPLTLMILIAPQFISTGIYMLTFPLFIIQAIESHPMYKPNPGENISLFGIIIFKGKSSDNKIKQPLRIPVFATTQWLEYLIISFCGNYFCCIRSILLFLQKCGRLFGI